jgi:hypothetical protein
MSQESTGARQPAPSSDVMRPSPAGDADRAAAPEAHPLAPLHQALGNNAVLQRLAQPAVQAKLEVGDSDDPQEREAEASAEAFKNSHPEERDPVPTQGLESLRRASDDKKKPSGVAPPGASPKAPAAPATDKPKAPAAGKEQPAGGPAPPQPKDGAAKEQPKDVAAPAGKAKADDAGAAGGAAKGPAADRPGTAGSNAAGATADAKQPEAERDDTPGPSAPGGDKQPATAKPGATPEVTPEVEKTIAKEKAGGQPLPASVLELFETRFGRDLSKVRVHTSGEAAKAAAALRARAFTYGQDVFFAAGQYQPNTPDGRELLAHEVTHTVQQSPSPIVTRKVQRAPVTTKAGTGSYDKAETPKTIKLPSVDVPAWRATLPAYTSPDPSPLTRPAGYTRDGRMKDEKDQVAVWKDQCAPGVQAALTALLTEVQAIPANGSYSLESKGAGGRSPRSYTGSPDRLAKQLTTPDWDRAGTIHGTKRRGFEVDHVRELQLGGSNEIGNMELLDQSVNSSSGGTVRAGVDRAGKGFVTSLSKEEADDSGLTLTNWSEWRVQFDKATGISTGKTPAATDRWAASEIQSGLHLDKRVLQESKPQDAGSASSVEIRITSGPIVKLNPAGSAEAVGLFKPFDVVAQQWEIGDDWQSKPSIVTFTLGLPKTSRLDLKAAPPPVQVARSPNARYVGVLDASVVAGYLDGLTFKELSSVNIRDVELDADGLRVSAQIIADVPIIKGSPIDLTISGDAITISKTFSGSDFKLPSPLKVTGSTLNVSASTTGEIAVAGRVDAEIEKLGKGWLETKGANTGWALGGGFKFSSEAFERAEVAFKYEDGEYSGSGEVTIGAKKVKGLRRASLKVRYEKELFVGDGDAEFDIPTIESGKFHLEYGAAGLVLSSEAKLKKMPGLDSGSLSVTVTQASGSELKLKGSGKATSSIDAVKGAIEIDYDDGMFIAIAKVDYAQGKLKGELQAGATNRPVDQEGKPGQGGKPEDPVTIFGYGKAELTLAPWLKGEAGIQLLASGELVFKGRVELTGKNLYEAQIAKPRDVVPPVGTTIPIFTPLFVALSAGVKLEAGINPGVLSGYVAVEYYNPAREAETRLSSGLKLQASAFAELKLYTTAGIGAGVALGPIDLASIKGNITLSAGLRLTAAASVEVGLKWTPGSGISADANLDATLSPALRVTFSADVVAQVIGIIEKTWHIAEFSRDYGSGLAFGLTLPIHYEEGKELKFDFEKADIRYPTIKPLEIAENFIKEVAK